MLISANDAFIQSKQKETELRDALLLEIEDKILLAIQNGRFSIIPVSSDKYSEFIRFQTHKQFYISYFENLGYKICFNSGYTYTSGYWVISWD